MLKKLLAALGGSLVGLLALTLLLGGVLYTAAAGEYSLPATVDQDASLPSIVIDGVSFHAEAFGEPDAPVAIVLHGGPGNDYRYLLELKMLSDNYRVVFYDQRGTGLSPRVAIEQLTLDNMIDDVGRIVDHYSHGKPVRLIGHSWGAMLASAYVGRHPKRVSHLVLAEPGMLTTEAAQGFMKKFKLSLGWHGVKQLVWLWFQSRHVPEVDGQERDDYFFTKLVSLDVEGSPTADYFCGGRPKPGTMKFWRLSFASNQQIQEAAMANLERHPIDLVKGVEQYGGKTLFLTGSCNTMTGEAFQRRHHLKFFPGADFVVLEGSGHAHFGEQPIESVGAVRKFLEQ